MRTLVAVTCVGVGVGVYALDCYSKIPLLAAARRRLKRLKAGPALRAVLGSTNPGKLKALEAALAEWAPDTACDVGGFATSSGVPDQPVGLEETLLGAKNRALAAFEKQRQLDLLLFGESSSRAGSGSSGKAADEVGSRSPFIGVGLESGLVVVDGATIDTCACAIFDGTRLYVGFSSGWSLPPRVATAIAERGYNQAFEDIGIPSDDRGAGVLARLSTGTLSRPKQMSEAIHACLLQHANASLYEDYEPLGVVVTRPVVSNFD